METTYQVILIAPSIWEDLTQTSFSELPPQTKPIAHSILATLQNRHIGITPNLSAELAHLITNPHSPHHNNPWTPTLKRLLEETSNNLQPTGILLNTIPLYTIIRLAAPIIEEANNQIQLCCLFCQDNIQNDTTKEDYNQYQSHLETQIHKIAETKNDFMQTFWQDRALTLASYSSHAPSWNKPETRLAELEPSALSLMLKLTPKLPKSQTLTIRPKIAVDPLKHQETRRMSEGGFSGIQITRRLDDMGDILLSEFLNPPAVLADRLINNGYLSLRRQTRREQLRDVLIVGMMPDALRSKPSTHFIKACWFDFIARFGFMLYRGRLMRSEFRWLEGDPFGRVRNCNFLLNQMPRLDMPGNGDLPAEFRREFLMALGWLPQYLDTRGRFEKIPVYDAAPQQLKVSGETNTENERKWAYSAWRSQKENLLWSLENSGDSLPGVTSPTGQHEKRLNIGGYAFVHIMLFLPAEKRREREASAAARLGPLYSGFGLGSSPGSDTGHKRSAGITWVPENLTDSSQWAFDCRGTQHSNPFSQQTTQWTSHKIAGRLEEIWRSQILKEMQDGR
ncbi:MAG: hypothetical protein GY940_17995 [bacterium]|nr:hypothetical protein [bacterium]